MEDYSYLFISPEDGELLTARYRGVFVSFQNRMLLLSSLGGKTEEVTPGWWVALRNNLCRASKVSDFDRANEIHREMWEKSGALRELQKEAALAGRFDVVDYITSVLNAFPPLGR